MLTRRLMSLLAIVIFMGIPLLGMTSTVHAATPDVCPSGCTYSQIQPAIDAGKSGDTIQIALARITETSQSTRA